MYQYRATKRAFSINMVISGGEWCYDENNDFESTKALKHILILFLFFLKTPPLPITVFELIIDSMRIAFTNCPMDFFLSNVIP